MAEAVVAIALVAVGRAVDAVARAVKAGWNGAKVIEEVPYPELDVAVASNAEIAPIEVCSRPGCSIDLSSCYRPSASLLRS